MPDYPDADIPVLAELTDIFRAALRDPDLEISAESSPDDIPGWDSMTHIAVVVEVECRFGVQFHTGEIEDLRNVGALIRHIRMKQAHAVA